MKPSESLAKQSRTQFSLRAVLVACTLFAVALAFAGKRVDFLMYGLTAAAVAGGLPLLVGGLPHKLTGLLLAMAASASTVAALQCYTLESTFGSYVYDGIPIAGWPRVFATGEGQFPAPATPSDLTLFGGHYWSRPNDLRFDLYVSGVVIVAIGLLCIRLRATSPAWHLLAWLEPSRTRTRLIVSIGAWFGRVVAVVCLAGWLIANQYFYDPAWVSAHDVKGTWLHWLTLAGLAIALPLPVCFPAHRSTWHAPGVRLRQKIGIIVARSFVMAASAFLLCVFMLRGAIWIGARQNYYLNLQVTWTLLAIGLVLGGSFAWRSLSSADELGDHPNASEANGKTV